MNINELDRETAEKLGVLEVYKKAIRKPREQKFSKEQVRSNAIKVSNPFSKQLNFAGLIQVS